MLIIVSAPQGFPSHLGHHGALNRVPCVIQWTTYSALYRGFSLVTYFIHSISGVYMPTRLPAHPATSLHSWRPCVGSLCNSGCSKPLTVGWFIECISLLGLQELSTQPEWLHHKEQKVFSHCSEAKCLESRRGQFWRPGGKGLFRPASLACCWPSSVST